MNRLTFTMTFLANALLFPGLAQGTRLQEDGASVLSRVCTSCHDSRRIQTSAHDREGWIEIMNRMRDHGAEVGLIEQIALIDYLVDHHGPVPEGQGRELVLERCTVCHDLARVREHRGTRELWEDALQAMLNEGAVLDDREFAMLIDYLYEHFGPESD